MDVGNLTDYSGNISFKKVEELDNGLIHVLDKYGNEGFINPNSDELFVAYPGQGGANYHYTGEYDKDDEAYLRSQMLSNNPPEYSVWISRSGIKTDYNMIEESYTALGELGINVNNVVASGHSASGDLVFNESEEFLSKHRDDSVSFSIISSQPAEMDNIINNNGNYETVKNEATIYLVGNESGSQNHREEAEILNNQGYNTSYIVGDSAHLNAQEDLIKNGIIDNLFGNSNTYGNTTASSSSAAFPPNFRTDNVGTFNGVVFQDGEANSNVSPTNSEISSNSIGLTNISDDLANVSGYLNTFADNFSKAKYNALELSIKLFCNRQNSPLKGKAWDNFKANFLSLNNETGTLKSYAGILNDLINEASNEINNVLSSYNGKIKTPEQIEYGIEFNKIETAIQELDIEIKNLKNNLYKPVIIGYYDDEQTNPRYDWAIDKSVESQIHSKELEKLDWRNYNEFINSLYNLYKKYSDKIGILVQKFSELNENIQKFV